MKIRSRIALVYTLLTAGLMLVFGGIIYWSAESNRENAFFSVLQNEATTKANLFFHAQVDEATLQKIYKSNRELIDEVEVAIYELPFELIYHDAVDIDVVQESPEMLKSIEENQVIQFYENDWQVIGTTFTFEEETYILTAAGYDTYGLEKLYALRQNILFIFLLSIIVVYLAGIFIAKKAFDPIKSMIDHAKKISAARLDLRLKSFSTKDELSDLTDTFNAMLERLEKSFDAQNSFVSNIAHEIRTPLAALIGELELALKNNEQNEAFVTVLQSTLNDARRLSRIASSLLDLAKANFDQDIITYTMIRIDEILLDACHDVQKMNTNYQTNIQFVESEEIEHDEALEYQGNEYLLKIAFINIIENACKYSSDNHCLIQIKIIDQNKVSLYFSDTGIGIASEELEHITKPFYRVSNTTGEKGSGIGLSLVERIVELHKGHLEITSKVGQGTTVIIAFNSVKRIQ